MAVKLAEKLLAAFNKEGAAVTRRERRPPHGSGPYKAFTFSRLVVSLDRIFECRERVRSLRGISHRSKAKFFQCSGY